MVAEFKSHVLSRDEKGFMGIPFKRLLLAGVGGGLVYTFTKIAVSDWSIPLAIAIGIIFIVLTAPQGGVPRWQRFLYYVRGSVMLSADRHPEGIVGSLARIMELPAELVTLDAGVIFAPPTVLTEANLTEWVTFAQAEDADRNDGLVFVNAPLEVK
jgi:hypothetical protein